MEPDPRSTLSFHVTLLTATDNVPREPLQAFRQPSLLSAVTSALPVGVVLLGLDATARDARDRPSMLVQLHVASVAPLAELRSLVLSGDFDASLTQALRAAPRVDTANFTPLVGEELRIDGLRQKQSLNGLSGVLLSHDEASGRLAVRLSNHQEVLVRAHNVFPPHLAARADRSDSARQFEAGAVALDTLTPHQQLALDQMAAAPRAGFVLCLSSPTFPVLSISLWFSLSHLSPHIAKPT